MILCLDSPSHYKKWELCSDELIYYGAYRLFFGLIDLSQVRWFYKLKPADTVELDSLLTSDAYAEVIASEE